MNKLACLVAFVLTLAPTGPLLALPVVVEVRGSVEFNQIPAAPLGNLEPGDPVSLIFLLDSDSFVDNMTFPTRGYDLDPLSMILSSGATMVRAQHPFPGGLTPFFVLRNDDPAVDGFFLSTGLDLPAGIPLAQTGVLGEFQAQFSVTYEGGVLQSLDITEAFGTYDFTQLTVFNWTVDDGPFQPLGLLFEELTIAPPGQIFADGFESGDLTAWTAINPQ